jgi:carboxyl-terminal processing protease
MKGHGMTAAGLMIACWAVAAGTAAARGNPGRDIKPLTELIGTVQENYAGDERFKTGDLVSAALTGMVSGLDRYSEFLDVQKYKDLQEDTKGSFGGVGIEIGIVHDRLSVIAPIEGTPADKAGLQGGDFIAYIDGAATDGMKIMEAVHRIKGPPGTKVTLTVIREGCPPRDAVMTRAVITPVNIRDTTVKGIGYVAIQSFSENTSANLAEALNRFSRQKVPGVILDLRQNPGGLLNEACRVADLFLPPGKLIVSTEGRDPAQRAKFYSTEKGGWFRMPLIVLTNESSASGSEIVAGALKDWGRAVIAGRRSFGKASVQSIQPITSDKSQALRLTVAHYYTPKHSEIHEVGIEPDVILPPMRLPSLVRRLQDDGAFTRFAAEVLVSATSWLDARSLSEGLAVPALKETAPERVDRRIEDELRRFCAAKGFDVPEEAWDEIRVPAVQQVRIALMRKAKGVEATRRYAVEFDAQVKTAADLLALASARHR